MLTVCVRLSAVVVGVAEPRSRRDLDLLRLADKRRSLSIPPLVRPMYDDLQTADDDDDVVDDIDERQTYAIPRMGRDDTGAYTVRYERHPPVPRIGDVSARLQRYLAEYRRDSDDDNEDDGQQIRQIYVQIPRVGRRSKRSIEDASREKRAVPAPRLGERQVALQEERAVPAPRLGMRSEDDEDDDEAYDILYWPDNMVFDAEDDIDVDEDNNDEATRATPTPRLGVMKKAIGMLRMGKRGMGMLRMGKRGMGMLRMGKRGMGMLRMGKRGIGMLRMGKRTLGMLRMGKRGIGMLRMGKRPMGMLRMGKRGMGMLRMGKRPMGMLRMGKRSAGSELSSTEK